MPAGAVAIAAAMYAACFAAERAARPEALKEIGGILKDSSWSRRVRPSTIIERVFSWTFGERHLSWKCARRSATASAIFVGILVTMVELKTHLFYDSWSYNIKSFHRGQYEAAISFLLFEITIAFATDYVALAKTRLILRTMTIHYSRTLAMLIVPIDILLSLGTSLIGLSLWVLISNHLSGAGVEYIRHGLWPFFVSTLASLPTVFSGNPQTTTLLPPLISTLFTSVWTILFLASTSVIKLLAPLHSFTAWFFDVEKHPVQAIGIVAGALVMLASLFWSVVRALT
jgi:hypothetical protein